MKNIRNLIFLLAAGLIISSIFNSCESCIEGQGPTISEDRAVDPYTKLEINIAADVTIVPGDKQYVRIQAQNNLLKIIKTNVRGKTLEVDSRPCFQTDSRVKIELTANMLSSVKINGSANVKTSASMNTEDFDVSINGSGQYIGDIFANAVNAEINGSGNIIINGSTKKLDVEINGSGDFKGIGFKAFEANISVKGSGDVDINALNKLRVEVLGSGDVTYVGNPDITTSIDGSGKVSKKEL
jgi:hypothetical protein